MCIYIHIYTYLPSLITTTIDWLLWSPELLGPEVGQNAFSAAIQSHGATGGWHGVPWWQGFNGKWWENGGKWWSIYGLCRKMMGRFGEIDGEYEKMMGEWFLEWQIILTEAEKHHAPTPTLPKATMGFRGAICYHTSIHGLSGEKRHPATIMSTFLGS